MNTILGNIYPVGSTYISTTNSCPLSTLISGSTWTQIASNVVVSVNTNVPVKGNGKAIGIKLASGTVGGFVSHGDSKEVGIRSGNYNLTNSTSGTSGVSWGNSIGLQPDANNSGIVGTVTRTNLTLYIFKRTT